MTALRLLPGGRIEPAQPEPEWTVIDGERVRVPSWEECGVEPAPDLTNPLARELLLLQVSTRRCSATSRCGRASSGPCATGWRRWSARGDPAASPELARTSPARAADLRRALRDFPPALRAGRVAPGCAAARVARGARAAGALVNRRERRAAAREFDREHRRTRYGSEQERSDAVQLLELLEVQEQCTARDLLREAQILAVIHWRRDANRREAASAPQEGGDFWRTG